jgi:hypothetical protein
MATPSWVRHHRARERASLRAGRAELVIQSLERVEQEQAEAAKDWTPRRGMSFASEE